MAKIHTLRISNFRSIKDFEQVFGLSSFVCIIGRGDSGKTTILDAISYVLCGNWNLSIFDTDFYGCNIDEPIIIEATLYDLPARLLQESRFGLYIRGIDMTTNTIHDTLEDSHIEALTIRFTVERDLEPRWCVTNVRQEDIEIRASDRASLNMFFVSDYVDKHFSWNKGNPLYSLLRQEDNDLRENGNPIIDALRDAKSKIDNNSFSEFDSVMSRIKSSSAGFGIDIQKANTTVDLKDIIVKEGKVTLHEDSIPFRLKGKGSKRLISIAIQVEVAKSVGGILLIDEIEQGLEPDRAQHLAKTLRESYEGQVFIITHSRDVLVELKAENLYRMAKDAKRLFHFDDSFQGVLRANPEAFFAKKIIVCEGATEVGIVRAINNHRIKMGRTSATLEGVKLTDGKGSNQVIYSDGFLRAGFEVCMFCDSDEPNVNRVKESLRSQGISIIDCEDNLSIEQQVFKDLPWAGVKQLIEQQKHSTSNASVEDSVGNRYKHYVKNGVLKEGWADVEDEMLRLTLGDVAKDREWFKSITKGEMLGTVCCDYFSDMKDSRLNEQFEKLSKWIEHA
ncbi:ATP-dependent nuclease [Pontibacter mangrovi]|uniref:ATPase AAA-type core domain-containing protein n=1 Tax=Pontibacter mangrovi TaxID=2589816 RepID=A0A501W493_9BACT|nr:ATP-binding protein [Pontibacter mangrovi]TPE43602.1 hypothetical protein FJM65_12665 [Pontibacter mangrovi]